MIELLSKGNPMNRVVEEKLDQIFALCDKYKVAHLELFGSATGEDFDTEKSDIDFLVEFQEMTPREHKNSYFGLLENLEDLFQRKIDIIEVKEIKNPYLIESINRSRRTLYAA
jgi:uncharacterized protein